MNIEVFGRLRSVSVHNSKVINSVDKVNLELESGDNTTLTNKLFGNKFTFQQVFEEGSSNYNIYHSAIEPLLSLFQSGWNTCFITTGCKGSGKTQTLAGNGTMNVGVFNIVLEQMFLNLGQNTEKEGHSLKANASHNPHVSMLAFDVDGEHILDLLSLEQSADSLQPKMHDNAENGVCVQNVTSVTLNDSLQGQSLFHQAWSNHSPTSNLFIQLELDNVIANTVTTTRSYFTFVVIPISIPVGLTEEVLPVDSRAKETSLSSGEQTFVCLTRLVAALANQPYAERIVNYSECLMTKLLQNSLGGNCLTRLLMCFSPFEDPLSVSAMFELAYSFCQVKNFPIINEVLSQQLLTQYRTRIINLQQRIDSGTTGVNNSTELFLINRLKNENVKLLESNKHLLKKIDELQKKYGKLAGSKTDLTTQLLKSDEDKLKMSKSLVDMQIDNNRLKEDVSATKFELTNKIHQLEIAIADADENKKVLKQIADSAQDQLDQADKRYRELSEDFARLQSHNMLMSAAYDKQHDRRITNAAKSADEWEEQHGRCSSLADLAAACSGEATSYLQSIIRTRWRHDSPNRNDQLSLELLKMVNLQLSAMEQSDAAEKDREHIRTLINRLTIRPEAVQRFDEVRASVEKPGFEAMNKLQARLDQERIEFEQERSQFRRKM